MMEKTKANIMKKKYYKVSFNLSSPLILGSGFSAETDKDILKDSKGIPFIPASSIAGICQSVMQNLWAKRGLDETRRKEKQEKYFGYVSNDGKENIQSHSKICFYDATIFKGTPYISVRDGVGLDEYKVARKGAKFDMEVLEPGVTFVTYFEQNFYFEDEEDIIKDLAMIWKNAQIYLGAKTMRGYGAIQEVQVWKKEFDFSKKDSVTEWLSFDMYADWNEDEEEITGSNVEDGLLLELRQVGGISIRKYTTRVKEENEESVPDSEQLTIWNNGKEIPVIPGSSWAGAFLHRMKELDPQENYEALFGVCKSEEQHKKSVIRFSESQIMGAKEKVLTRNAIDRFSGGAMDKALFTEKTYYGGSTTLKISFSEKKALTENAARTLAACITDLHYGFLSVGGLTAVGRGLFCIEKVNGQKVADDKLFQSVLEILEKEIVQ